MRGVGKNFSKRKEQIFIQKILNYHKIFIFYKTFFYFATDTLPPPPNQWFDPTSLLVVRSNHYFILKNKSNSSRKVKRDIVTKKAEKDAMIGNNSMDTIVTGRPIEKRNEIIVADQSKARIKKYGTGSSEENWEFLAEVEDEVQLDQVRKINGLGKWKQNDNTTWLRCTRKSTFQSCPYRGVYVKADRILYHRGAHTTTMRRELEGKHSDVRDSRYFVLENRGYFILTKTATACQKYFVLLKKGNKKILK